MSKTPPWKGEGHVDPENRGTVPPYEPYVPPAEDEPEEPQQDDQS